MLRRCLFMCRTRRDSRLGIHGPAQMEGILQCCSAGMSLMHRAAAMMNARSRTQPSCRGGVHEGAVANRIVFLITSQLFLVRLCDVDDKMMNVRAPDLVHGYDVPRGM